MSSADTEQVNLLGRMSISLAGLGLLFVAVYFALIAPNARAIAALQKEETQLVTDWAAQSVGHEIFVKAWNSCITPSSGAIEEPRTIKSCLNETAAKYGVTLGITLEEAQALYDRMHSLALQRQAEMPFIARWLTKVGD